MFDWEQGIGLHGMQGNRASSFSERESDGFSRVAAGSWGMSRGTAREDIKNFGLFSDIRTPI